MLVPVIILIMLSCTVSTGNILFRLSEKVLDALKYLDLYTIALLRDTYLVSTFLELRQRADVDRKKLAM